MHACFGGEGEERSLPGKEVKGQSMGKLNFVLQEKEEPDKVIPHKNLLEEKDSNHPA